MTFLNAYISVSEDKDKARIRQIKALYITGWRSFVINIEEKKYWHLRVLPRGDGKLQSRMQC